MTAGRSIADLPGPPALPLLGNVHQLQRGRMHQTLEEWCRRYGPIFRVKAGRRPMVCIGETETINEILRDRPEGYRRPDRLRDVFEDMTAPQFSSEKFRPGVFAAEGDDWKRQRRLVVTALNTNHLHRYFETVRTATERLHRRLRTAAQDERALRISDELTSFTVDVTTALAFGQDLNTLERGDGELQRHIQRVFRMTARRYFAPVPYWKWIRLPEDRALDRSLAEMYGAIGAFIEAGKARLAARPELHESPENLLDGLLAAQAADEAIGDQEVVYNVFTILLAGEDTTAHTLGWTLWLLASRPDVQRRLAAEAAEAFEDEHLANRYEATERLAFAEAVLRESMRLKSVVPLIGLEPTGDKTICGTRVPAGTQLLLLLRHAGHGPAGRSEEFHPERWLEDSEETRPPRSLGFGAGARFCPGRNLAFLEAKAALAMIARNFELELDDPGGSVWESFGFTMAPRGLQVRLKNRFTTKKETTDALEVA
jgi:cytochrome P450